ncbi:YbaB/EbfC family nucleoid-associated protein [Nocardia cyriacigeorgica]|uniref:YbaB/EbfC family nucleoid-associated protein n=1 Tax=Nocardia cyriacigeorgica TaxID=135487 RepID=UPI0024574574|nr:YbaB/EbfC family nucleoid-associated protein [Nocardia cyriacigeorgica]
MDLDDELDRIQQQSEQQFAEAFRRVSRIEGDCQSLTFDATSGDGLATVRVSSAGTVLSITLSKGFGDMSRPTWALADDLDAAATAIQDAVNRARALAGKEVHARFVEEFPEAYELLDDLR